MRSPSTNPRVRDAEQTRRSLMAAALELFSLEAYDRVGVRAIADRAGVNQALLNRYFGSKAGLFREVVNALLGDIGWFAGDRATFGERVAAHICAKNREAIDPLLIFFRSTAHPESAEIVREALDRAVIGPLADWIGGPGALTKAAAIVSLLFGTSVLSVMLESETASGANAEAYRKAIADALQTILDG